LPDTILSRSIVIRMRRRHASEQVEQFRRRLHVGQGNGIKLMAQKWAKSIEGDIVWPELPPEITDGTADSWESLIAIADLAAPAVGRRRRVPQLSGLSNMGSGPKPCALEGDPEGVRPGRS